jgi:hypothetical protein
MAESEFLFPPWRRVPAGSLLLNPVFRPIATQTPIFLAYSQYQSLMLGQVAGCNRLHDVTGRLARWLLMVQDRTGNTLLKLTQEFLAEMIGSQRTTVSEVAGGLQDRGLIEYARGSIKILDRIGLENASCECYPTTRNLLIGVYKLADQSVFEDPR